MTYPRLQSGRPVLPKGYGGPRRVYPLNQMKVGECFKMPMTRAASLRSTAWRASRDVKKFVVRKTNGFVWCWRTK